MIHVSRACSQSKGRPLFLCDVSPPRGADHALVERVRDLPAHFLGVAYSPGKSVRVDPVAMAAVLKQTGKDVVFNLGCRDGNKLMLQNYLLGAHLLGLENILVLKGDDFTATELGRVKDVNDYTPTGLIAAIRDLNQGVDYRGLKLRMPTSFCVGATLDFGLPLAAEAALARRKVEAGADFFVTQPIYDLSQVARFYEAYPIPRPIFYGLQILDREGINFGEVPPWMQEELEKGRPGVDIALEQIHTFIEAGMCTIYLVPPILKGGRRDYAAARWVLEGALGVS